MAQEKPRMRTFLTPLGQRWLNWLTTMVIVTGLGVVFLPLLRQWPEGLHVYFSSADDWQRHVVIFSLSVSVVAGLFKPLSPRFNHLYVTARVPPKWLAWAVAAGLLCLLDLTVGLGPADFEASFWEWAAYGGGAVLVVAGYRFLSVADDRTTSSLGQASPTSVENLIQDWSRVERWLLSERPADEDLIGNRHVARRLAEYLVTHGRSVGLVGPFGSGKTSVANWLQADVEEARKPDQPKIWFCEQSCWGFEDSATAVQQILERGLKTVGKHADCFSIRSLPESYRKTFSVGGDWFRNLLDVVLGSPGPTEQFAELAEILTALNARLVFIIEDLDCNSSQRFDRQEIMALLQRLRAFDRISFVLTSGRAGTRDIDFAKLCDHIEVIHEFGADQIAALIQALRKRCLHSFQHVATAPADDDPWNPVHYWLLSRFDVMPPPVAAARLLRTPRALKHTLRRTLLAWQVLYGEVDFDHLLAVNILRYGASEAFDFLLRHWERLRENPEEWRSDRDQLPKMRDQMRQEWQRATRKVEWDSRAALELIEFLIPASGNYLWERQGRERERSQGITHERYWLRIVNEQIDPAQAKDQTVLRDLQQWIVGDSASPLVERLCLSPDYAAVWEHLAPSMMANERGVILGLAQQVLDRLRMRSGARVSGENLHPALAAVWRRANRVVQPDDESRTWLEGQIRHAMPVSLSLVNDLYYYWASPRSGIVRLDDRPRVRHLVCDLAREQFRTSRDLSRVLHPELNYCVYQLVFPPDTDDGPSECRGVEAWRWLGPILLDGLRKEPARFAQEIGHLITRRDLQDPRVVVRSVDHGLLTGFFGESSEEVIRLIEQERNRAQGSDRNFLDEILRSAQAFLHDPPEDQRHDSR